MIQTGKGDASMVYILLATGFEEMEALVPADLLHRAGVKVALVGLDTPSVTGSHSISVNTDLTADQVTLTSDDMLLLPGGMVGVTNLSKSGTATALIQTAYETGCWLAAICAAPTLLGQLGLLQDRKAICYPGMEDRLIGATVVDENVVIDDRIITSRAAGTAYDFGLTLVALLTSQSKSEEVRHGIKYRT